VRVVEFTAAHIGQAMRIAKQNYDEERVVVPALPRIDAAPDLLPYTENALGVAAFDGSAMLGFLCSVLPFKNAFSGSTSATGVFSPMGANGATGDNRAEVYAKMYQTAGEKWVRAGASSHGISLYAHDKQVQEQFFRYGFGLRCVDAIRAMDDITAPPCDGYSFNKVTAEGALAVLPLENMLHRGFLDSPFFMFKAEHSETGWLEYWNKARPVCFISEYEGKNVAFILAEHDGENFIKDTPGYLHITGMFCLPEHRGKGVSKKLLSLLTRELKEQGFTRLGTDFESINPSGSAFWRKYFTAYTHSVVRRIDENAIITGDGK